MTLIKYVLLQTLTNCKCKAFFGSVADMKGNEARIIFFLHPVKEFKEGQVSKAKPRSMLLRFRCILLILGTSLALGVLGYVLYSLTNEQFVEDFFTTVYPLETTRADQDIPIAMNTTQATTTGDTSASIITTENEVSPTDLSTSRQTTTMTTATTTTTTKTTTVHVSPTPGSQNVLV